MDQAQPPTEPLMVGTRSLTTPSAADTRLALLLWGTAGCGKTTLASTAPGVKLWVQFDPLGTDSLMGRDDVMILDLSGEKHAIVERFKQDDPLGIERLLGQHPEIETIVLDSMTAFSLLATENAVLHVKSATIENPGIKGYGHRGALVQRATIAMMRLTRRLNRHIIFTAHEDTPDKDDNGAVLQITTSLSAKQTNNLGMALSEIWWMQDTGKEFRIAVRPVRQRTPMKSRMFDSTGTTGEFPWRFDPRTWKGDGIATWFDTWQKNGGRKIPLPK